jgi:hypothetical protein
MKRHQLIALAAIVLVACVDGGRSNGPSFAISDAVHDGGTAGFYFLPPMVPNPTPTGTFDRFRSPAVEICQLLGDEDTACTTTIATFTMTSGVGSVIRVVPPDEHYIVNWHTNLFPNLLSTPTIYRIQVFDQESAPRKLLGFADVQLADNGKEAKSLTSGQMIGLVDGRTLPIKFRIEFGAVDLCPDTPDPCAKATVGPDGGPLVATDDAGVALAFADFPAGWTDTPREVTISQIVSGCDGACQPGQGPLAGAPEGVRQYPLFFEYSTVPPSTPEEPFNLPVRIGVCNVGAEFGDAFHPPHRGTTALALGAVEDHGFVILDFAPTGDLLGGCVGVTPTPGVGGGEIGLNRLDGGWQGLLARAGVLAANVFAPRTLNAAVLVDGGMGGSTEFFSPVGTVDTATAAADLTIHDLSISPANPTAGASVTLGAIVSNSGGATAAPATVMLCIVQFLDGGTGSTCAQMESPTLAPGTSATISGEVSVFGPGSYAVVASVDTFEVVPESDETNNNGVGPAFRVTAPPPTLDGVMVPGEWDDAAQTSFTVNVPGGTTDGILFVKNDGENLYLAVRFARDVVDETSLLGFEFDNNSNGAGPEDGDEYFNFAPGTGFSDAYRSTCGELPAGCVTNDRTDGAGAFHNDGAFSVYELSHSLNSGETGKDFALIAPTRIGVMLQLTVGTAQTRFPAGPFPTYMTISITASASP